MSFDPYQSYMPDWSSKMPAAGEAHAASRRQVARRAPARAQPVRNLHTPPDRFASTGDPIAANGAPPDPNCALALEAEDGAIPRGLLRPDARVDLGGSAEAYVCESAR